ncbi:MAG TPA: hypothetical protein VFF06_31550 [Polyangia bacterium]|nr:hypothetical protein [Polyangia bacterium]
MKNAMKIATPSEKQIEKLLRELQDVNDGLARYVVQMSTGEKQRSVKPRRGGESVGELIANVISKRKLTIPGVSPGEIAAERARAARLRPLQLAAKTLARSLGDAVFAAESKAWATTVNLYSVLTKLSDRDKTLKPELAPATEFFALGKRKPKPTPPAPPATK